ncbi:MAG TPA: hypothetical protein VMT62_09680 [Syntrophorhabdaceae bacterium]|nr:hypothetical protein [Syntrophorhabdaceae bacterium]
MSVDCSGFIASVYTFSLVVFEHHGIETPERYSAIFLLKLLKVAIFLPERPLTLHPFAIFCRKVVERMIYDPFDLRLLSFFDGLPSLDEKGFRFSELIQRFKYSV